MSCLPRALRTCGHHSKLSRFILDIPGHTYCAPGLCKGLGGRVQASALLHPVLATSPETMIKLRRDKCNEVREGRESSRGHRGSPSRAASWVPVLSSCTGWVAAMHGTILGQGPCGRWGSRNPGVDLPRVWASCQEVTTGEHSWAGPGLQKVQSTMEGRALTRGSPHPPGPPRTPGQCFPQAGPVCAPWFGVACASPRQG